MKVLIITWLKYNNYGTVLQAYALQHKIKKIGYDVKTLDDHGVGFDLIDKKPTKFKILLKLFCATIKYPFNYKNRKKYQDLKKDKEINVFDEFKNKFIDIEYNLDDKRYLNNHYQAFISGSDQIWSPLKTIFSKHYYLDFVDKQNSKISYAPSTGQNNCSDEMKKIIKPLLEDFEYISVREKQGKQILNELTDKEVKVVLDPTLLLYSKDWDEITTKRIIKNKYIFTYFLSNNDWYNNYIKLISKKYNLKIFNLKNDFNLYLNDDIYKKNISPTEFLSLIKYADYVVTDSFHGSIFSLIYEKEFVCLKRFDDNTSNNQNARLYNLLNIVNLNERFIDKNNQVNLFDKKIDYKIVNEYLEEEIESSQTYLTNALENCKGNKVITHNCTSCMACFNSCPVNAIKIEKDKYGEFRPYIDETKCIKCGKCKKVCPSNNLPKFNEIKKCYAAISANKDEASNSASGGIAYEISKDILLNGGIVYGVIIDKNLNTKHARIDDILDLKNTQGSKYAQSYIGDTYIKVKEDLKNNKNVLFVGSPCQVAGLKNYLNKDYGNLLTIDLVCHGNVPNEYIFEHCKSINIKVNKVIFREKREYCLKLYDDDKLIRKIKNDKYLYTFLKDISLKESCHHCMYASKKRVGDITLGDFWALKSEIPYSIVMVNTPKGERTIVKLRTIKIEEKDINESIKGNDSFNHPQGKHPARILFNQGVVNGFNDGLKKARINRIIRRENYPEILKKVLNKVYDKINRVRNGEK